MAAYEVLLLNTAIPQIQAAQSGDTYVCPRDIAFSAALTLSAGTANGVPYLNGSKVLTTGSALTFDGSIVTNTGVGFSVDNTNALYRFRSAAGVRTAYLQARADAFDIWSDQAAVPMVFGVANAEGMRLTSTGLGIGTSSPSGKLHTVQSNGINYFESPGISSIALQFVTNGTNRYRIGIPSASADLQFLAGGTTETMRLDASGNLGLGVTPTTGGYGKGYQFSDSSADTLMTLWSQAINTDDRRLSITNNAKNTGAGTWGYYNTSSSATMYQQWSGKHAWFYAAPGSGTVAFTQAMTLDASGNLLVGVASGSFHKFHKSNAGDFAVQSANTSATTPYVHVLTFTAAAPNDATSMFLRCDDTGVSGRIQLRSNGGIANYQANDVNLSDRREKTNFAPAKSYLDIICAIPVQTFNYIDQSENDPGLTLGVVAQDVQAVAPELVSESNWGTEDNPKMRLSIYQTDLQYALMKCIQEQQAMIEELKAKVAAMGA